MAEAVDAELVDEAAGERAHQGIRAAPARGEAGRIVREITGGSST